MGLSLARYGTQAGSGVTGKLASRWAWSFRSPILSRRISTGYPVNITGNGSSISGSATVSYTEKWYPTGNYSSRGGSDVDQLTFHTSEGSDKGENLAGWIQNPASQVSYHAAVDNYSPGVVFRFVDSDSKAWSQAAGNPFALSVCFCTPSGAASGWSRDTWLAKPAMLDNAAAIGRTFCDWYGIPMTPLNASQAQSGARGISQHVDGGSSWSNHHDCGPGFPEDVVIQKMKGGGGGTAPVTEAEMMPAVAIFQDKEYYAWIDDGKIMYRGPDTQNKPACIDSSAGAIAGVGMQISPSGWTFITFTNSSGDPYVERRGPGGKPSWERFKIADA
jgi:N-acetylmuramoyl-L-alanine amidase